MALFVKNSWASSCTCFFDVFVLAASDDHISISCCSNALFELEELLLLLFVILLFSRRGGKSGLRVGDDGTCAVGESIAIDFLLQCKIGFHNRYPQIFQSMIPIRQFCFCSRRMSYHYVTVLVSVYTHKL